MTSRRCGAAAAAVVLACALPGLAVSPALAARPPAPVDHPARHQPPVGAPYRAQEVRIRVDPGVTLGGTLTLPDVAGARAPAVVLVSDAGAEDRDGVTAADTSRFYWALADTLSRRGIAVLRFDDRGVASSSGSLDSVDTFTRSFDARAGLDLLRRTPGVDPARLGVVGVGEGATIATIIAASDHTLAGIVLVGAPVRAGQERVSEYVREEARRAGAQRDSVERALGDAWRVRSEADPWLAFWAAHDPIATARRVRAASLVIDDRADRGAGELVTALRESGASVSRKTLTVFAAGADAWAPKSSRALSVEDGDVRDLLGEIADWVSRTPSLRTPRP